MKLLAFLLLVLGLGFSCNSSFDFSSKKADLLKLNQWAEKEFENQPAHLASLYAEEAILAGPSDQLVGKEQIENYWGKIQTPIHLDIEILNLTPYLDSLALPARFRKEIESDAEGNYIFQSGVFHLAYEREDVTLHQSKTPFTQVWKQQPQGYFRIVLELRK